MKKKLHRRGTLVKLLLKFKTRVNSKRLKNRKK